MNTISIRSLSSPVDVGSHNSSLPSGSSVLADTHSFFQSIWELHKIHTIRGQHPYWHTAWCLLPLGKSLLVGTSLLVSSLALIPFSNRYETPPNSPPFEASVFTGTPSHVYPFRGRASSLACRPVPSSDTICNGPSPPLVDIVLFGLPLKVFKTRLKAEGSTPL